MTTETVYMKPIKLYYDVFPGKKILHKEINQTITNFVEWQDARYSFHDILNVLGIPYEWTDNEKQGMVLVDIDSTPSSQLHRIIKLAGERFEKFILSSLTEVRYGYVVDNMLHDLWQKYPNMFLFDCGVQNPLYTKKTIASHPHYMGFPFMIPRTTSLATNGILVHGEHLNEDIANKRWNFNHLSSTWRLEKFLTFYYLQKYNVSNCVQSYKPPKDIDVAIGLIENEGRTRGIDVKDIVNRMRGDPAFYRDTMSVPYHDHAYSVNARVHPKGLYQDSIFSLVSESYHGAEERVVFVTEKCIQPMLNAHPCLIKGTMGINAYLKSLGFEVYEELFDYSFDLEDCMFARAEMVAKQVKDFNRTVVLDNFKTVMQKVSHNKNQLLNFQTSTVYKNLREIMLEYIDRYYT